MVQPLSDQAEKVVLLAEDNDDEVMLFKRAFKHAEINHSLRVVHDGEEAIAYLNGEGKFADRSEHPFPVLLLLDLRMPRKDGLQVLRWMRGQPAIKSLPVIMLSNSEDKRSVDMAYELGVNSFIVKSPYPNEFVEQLKDLKRYWLDFSLAPKIKGT